MAEETTAPEAGTPEYDAAMAAKYDERNGVTEETTEQTSETEQSDGFEMPEKFKGKSAEEIAKAYTELEKMKNRPPEQEATSEEQQSEAEQVQEATNKAGLDYDAIRSEFMENGGDLTQETKQKYYDQFGQEIVDDYIAAKRAAMESAQNSIYTRFGNTAEEGQAHFQRVNEHVVNTWSQGQIDAVNELFASGDPAKIDMAVNQLQSSYEKANGTGSRLLQPSQNTPAPGVERFESRAQVTEAMRDPRYKKDPGYRAQVQRRLANSDIDF